MIVGNGDIASALKDSLIGGDDSFLFFASGVSNSQETKESEYEREEKLLRVQPRDKRFVYFSTLSVFYGEGLYVRHKKYMESLVQLEFEEHTIIRLGNITWGNNPNTIINFLRNRLKDGKPLIIRDETRYIVDKKEFLHWINLIPDWNCEMNITGQSMTIKELVKEYVL